MNNKTILPTDCVLGLTYACNSRCIMCDIWKIKDPDFIDPEEYRKLPNSLRDINISGGEPFLHPRIEDIVQILVETCPKARIIISSNGFATSLVVERMKEILKIKPDIGVAISVDGVGDMHEQIRCIPDAFKKDMQTIEELQKLGMKNLRLAFTILPENIEHFGKVYDEAVKRGIQFTHAFAQSSDFYFGGIQIDNRPDLKELEKQYRYIIKNELKTWSPKRWARAYFAYGLYRFATKKEQVLSNDPGNKFFYLDPAGVVYPSVVHNHPMGNIKDAQSWADLWFGKAAQMARKNLQAEGKAAWMICTARTAIKKHPARVGFWVLKNKFGRVRL